MKPTFTGLGLMVLLAGAAFAQFEAADVQVSAPGTKPGGSGFAGSRFDLRGATMLDLISAAYGLVPDRVLGGPGWLNTDRFDVVAKAASSTASPEMLQALLADRFKLAIHNDARDLPVYALVVGKKGAKLQPAAQPGHTDISPVDGPPGVTHRVCHGCTMANLAEILPRIAPNYVDHPVVDMTGLTGSYDFPLDWMGKVAYLAAKAGGGDGTPAVGMFDAIDKLGLKLDPQKRPMPVIVIDSVNRTPTENLPGVTKKIPGLPTEFEVAELRPSKPGLTDSNGRLQNGRLDMQGATLKALIALAYDIDDARVTGPKWLDTDRFDIIAKAPATITLEAFRGMLKALIVERFKLETHNQDQPVTVVALAPGKRSPKLQEADGSARSECKLSIGERGRTYTCRNTTMAQFAERLPSVAGTYILHPTVDLTGLPGAYDFDLTWTPRGQLPKTGAKAGDAAQGPVQASTPAGDVTLFEAIDKQLGLKLEERKHPMPCIVIDKAERTPSEN